MSAHKITGLNFVLIRMSHILLWIDAPFSTQSLREYLTLIWPKYHILHICWLSILSNYWSMWKEKFFWISLWFSETFSITLFTNWSLIPWSYALNILRFCSNLFKSNFRGSRLPDLLLFKDNCSHSTRDLSRTSLLYFSQEVVWIFYTYSHHNLSDSLPLLRHLHHTDGKNHSLMFLYTLNWLRRFLYPGTL